MLYVLCDDFAIERTDTALTIRSGGTIAGWPRYLLMIAGSAGICWILLLWPSPVTVFFVVVIIAFALPRDVSTTFDLQTKEVRQTTRLCGRVRRRVIAYDDIESIGFCQPDPTEPVKFVVIRLKQKEQIRIASPGSVLDEKAMNLIAAVTSLPRVDTVYRWQTGV